ncbi:MAG: hypothetical protein ACUVWJ_00990 [Spirochaetota bacterium]
MSKNKFIIMVIAVYIFIFGVAVLINIVMNAELGLIAPSAKSDIYLFLIGLLFLLTTIIVAYACPTLSSSSQTAGGLMRFISFLLMFWFITRSIVVYGKSSGVINNDTIVFTLYSIMQTVVSKLVLSGLEKNNSSS